MIQQNLPLSDIEILNIEWLCNKCQIAELAETFPFGLETNHELFNINNLDSLKTLEMLPNYEIVSRASDIGALKQFDVDENIINNINFRYYPAYEFQKLKVKQTFNLFHTNLNGLEHKFE